jgi:hypothetical protein
MSCVIVIPVYKSFSELTENEIKSIRQACKILKQYPLFFTGTEALADTDAYLALATTEQVKAGFKVFPKKYFESIAGYNHLLLSKKFYKAFARFEHILIYQTDAYVFRDELDYWCKKKYCYIGAPWFEGWSTPVTFTLVGVGNGGFSLRKTDKHIDILSRVAIIKRLKVFCRHIEMKQFSFFIMLVQLLNFRLKIKSKPSLHLLNELDEINEDYFWGECVPVLFKDFQVAPVGDAMRFSFEANPTYLYEKCGKRLPFGCHAWEKFDPVFWRTFFQAAEGNIK